MNVLYCMLLSAVLASGGPVSESLSVVADVWLQNFVPTAAAPDRWDSGYVVTRDSFVAPARVYLYDRSGVIRSSRLLELPRASDLRVFDIAVHDDGTYAVAAGAAAGESGAYLIWLTATGEVRRYQKTSPFVPREIDFAGDGSLWVAGSIVDHSIRNPEDQPNHDILRRYAPDGTLLQTALDRDSFVNLTWQHPAAQGIFIKVHPDRIGFYSQVANEWVELDPDGAILGRWPGVSAHPGERIGGFGFLPDGRVYVSHRRLGVYRTRYSTLDKLTRDWALIDASRIYPDDGRNHSMQIYGNDGNLLVIGVDRQHLFWARPE